MAILCVKARFAAVALRRASYLKTCASSKLYNLLMEMIHEESYPKAVTVPEVTITSLLHKVTAYNPEADEELIARAYGTAHAAHRGQVRKSGEPFVFPQLCTANILAVPHLDAPTIAAALLHDVLEDTNLTKEELEAKFG